ncbi:MAG TPA: nitroreductase family protein [Anaerolineae bacterium]|nr:nitroreductase family protein [Anaerolineae bacterium]HOQ97741.1 nitroreductase family protein [Anaerolineae bacterium]HPL27285.1 nitroreductase family protein [Anaerolineae bacterium]
MPLDYGRGGGPAAVHIDHEQCNACGLCVRVCKGAPLYLEDGRVQVDQARLFGCIACGHCVAVCPRGCITVSGRDLSPEDVADLPPREARAGYDALHALLLGRRSVRDFQAREVGPGMVEQILDAASTAPMGLPPSEVGVLVAAGRAQVRALRDDLWRSVQGWRWLLSPAILALLRPFIGREDYRGFKAFIGPALAAYAEKEREGVDWFFYDAPLALYFYGSPCADPADPVIAATYAMLAAEALGLGSCLLGFPGYIMQYDGKLRKKYGLPRKIQPGLAMVLGYPALRYQRALRRRFAAVRHVGS